MDCQWLFGHAGLFIEKQIDIMELIPYEQFTINGNILKKLNEYYVSKKINEYYTQNGQLPDSGTVETFTMPEKLMDRYKKHFYAEYYRKEVEFEKEYGPSEMIETSFDFSATEDGDSTIFGTTRSGENGVEDDYQYKYWSVIVERPGAGDYMVGMFTSLKDATISLNSIRKYNIYVYHRKSNYQYDGLMRTIKSNATYGYEPVPLDNAFHVCPVYMGMDISSYSPWVNGKYISYETQMEDKEYFGVVKDYTPQKGGVISGYVYTLNPRMTISISGLTDEITAIINIDSHNIDGYAKVTFEIDENGNVLANGNSSGITKISDSLFTYLVTKERIVNTLGLSKIDSWAEYISNPNHCSVQVWVGGSIYDKNGNELGNMLSNDNGRGCVMCRNGLVNTIVLTVPPYGEYVDNGFDFNVIDD